MKRIISSLPTTRSEWKDSVRLREYRLISGPRAIGHPEGRRGEEFGGTLSPVYSARPVKGGRLRSRTQRKFSGIMVAPVSPLNKAWRIFRPPQNDAPVQRFV